jgi:hypothetical protein
MAQISLALAQGVISAGDKSLMICMTAPKNCNRLYGPPNLPKRMATQGNAV